MAQRSKPDAAERIAAWEWPYGDRHSTGDEDEYNRIRRKQLAARIRRAIRAAVKAERKRKGKR